MFHRIISSILIMTFALTSVVSPSSAQVLTGDRPLLITDPLGSVPVSVFSGIKIYPQEPFRFDFIMSEDNSSVGGVAPRGYPTTGEHRGSPLQDESMKLIKYFMASLTVPEGDLWVNLSPYEPDRIVPKALGQTEMGRDMLAQDYILKQLTASMMSPEGESGKKFWEKVYERLYEIVGAHSRAPVQNDGDDMQNAIESFNKVWIVPNKVEVYQNNDVAYIVNADFKVMLESDYLAEQAERNSPQPPLYIKRGSAQRGGVTGNTASADDVKNIIRDVIIPVIEDEVNSGASFANLRQIFHSMILAKWYEQHFKNSVLGQSYIDQNVVEGIKLESVGAHSRAPVQVQDIYNQYVAAFKSGASNLIKEEYDPVMQTVVPRKYFTGGVGLKFEAPEKASVAQAMLDVNKPGRVISFDLAMMDADKNLNLPNLDFSGEKAASARELIGTFHLEDLKVIDKKSFGDDLEIYTVEAPPIRDDMVIFEVPEIFRELVDRQYWENFKNQFSVDLVYRRQGDAVELIGILPNPESLSDIEGAEKDGFYYYDLSSYYVPYSVLREVTYKALLRWQEQARLILERQEALQAYLQADSSISLQSIAQKYKQQSPFYTLKFDVDADDELEVKPFLIQNVLDEDSEEAKFFEFEPEYQKAVLLNFLTVYSPYDEDNSIADKESNLTAMQRADEFDFQPGDRYLDHATGSGLVASIVVLVLKLRGLMVPVTVKDMNPLAEANALANVEHILGAKVDFNEDQMFAFVTSNAPHIGGWISPKYFWKYLLLDQMGQDELKYQMMDDDLKFLSRADELNYDFQDLYDGGISGSMYWIHFMMYLRHHLQPGKGEAVMWNQSDFMLEDPVWNPVFQQFKIYTSGRAGLRKSSFVLLLTGLVENWNWSDRQFNEYEFFYWISGEEGDQEEYVSDLKSGGKSLASKIIDGEVKVFLNAQGQNVSLEEFLRGIGNETEIILSDSPQGLTARLVEDNAMLDGQQDESPEEGKLRTLKKLHSVLLTSVGWELKGPLLLLSGWALWSYVQGDFVSFDILSVFSFIMLIACVASQYHASENIKFKKILEDYMTEQAEELKRKKEWEDGTKREEDEAMLQTASPASNVALSNDTTAVLEYESIVKYQQRVTQEGFDNWRAPMVHFVLANPDHFPLDNDLRRKAESFDDNPFLLEAKNTGGLKDAEVNAIVQMYWDYEGQGKIIPIVSKMLFGVYRQDWYRDHAEQLFDLELLKEFVLKNNILGQKRIIVTRTSSKIVTAQMEALGFEDVFEIVEARNDKAMLGAEVALFLKAMSTSTIWGAGDYLTQMYVRKQKSFDKYAMIRSALLGFVYAFFVHFEYSALNAWVSSPLAQAAIYLSIIGILNDMGLYSLSQALQKEEAKWWGENGFWDNFKKSFWIIYIYWTPIVLANIYWVPLDYVVYVSTAAAFLYKPVSLSIYRGLNLRKTLLIKNIGKKAGFEKLTKSQMGYLESFTFAELKILFADSPERLHSRIRFAMPPDRFAAKIRRIKKAFYSDDYHFRFDQLDWKVMETEEEWRFLNTLARKKNHGTIDVLHSFLVRYKDISADEFQGYFKKMWVIWKFSHGSQYFFSKAVESQYLPAIFSIVEVLARAGYRGVGGINNPKVSAVFSKYVQLLKKYKPKEVVEEASKEFLQEVIVSLADIIHRDGIEVFLEIFALVLEEKITNNNEFERNLTEARSKQNSNAAPGGIDLNNLNMQTSGQAAPMQMSDPAMMNVPINGLVPQIIHIGTMNVGQFLGLNDAPQDQAPESVTLIPDVAAIREDV